MRTLILLAAASALTLQGAELRGVWAARDSLGSREQIRDMMRNLDAANFNAVFVNVWSRGFTLWPSPLMEAETGFAIDPTYAGRDVLAEAIEEAKPFGIAVIPWVEYGFVGGFSGQLTGTAAGPIFEKHPDWLARTRAGVTRFPISGGGGDFFWLAHANPDVQEFLLQLMEELAERYDVPAIEFDRARYPQLDCGYDDATLQQYAADHDGAKPPDNPADAAWVRWRANNLNRFIEKLTRRVRAKNWRMLVTNAPIVFPFGYSNFAQDYPGWVRQGSLDFVSPQVYRADVAAFERELDAQIRAMPPSPTRLVPGIDITNSRSAENLAEQIRIVRRRNLPGFIVWYYQGLVNARALDQLRELVLTEKAALPWR